MVSATITTRTKEIETLRIRVKRPFGKNLTETLGVFLVALLCASLSNAFLFGHKFKNGCDPDPCKHESKCQLDPKNANLSTCACKGEYTGVHCELKTGCHSKPCKNDGKCKNDPKDLTKFKCKCSDGFVGNKCDTSESLEF